MNIVHADRSFLCFWSLYMDYVTKNAFDVINSAVYMITIKDQYTSAQLYIIRIISYTFRLLNKAIIRLHMETKKRSNKL